MVGKWHLGFYKWEYTPTYRGFDSFYGYYNALEDHFTHTVLNILDFHDNKEPVRDLNGKYGTFAFAEVKTWPCDHDALILFLYLNTFVHFVGDAET